MSILSIISNCSERLFSYHWNFTICLLVNFFIIVIPMDCGTLMSTKKDWYREGEKSCIITSNLAPRVDENRALFILFRLLFDWILHLNLINNETEIATEPLCMIQHFALLSSAENWKFQTVPSNLSPGRGLQMGEENIRKYSLVTKFRGSLFSI